MNPFHTLLKRIEQQIRFEEEEMDSEHPPNYRDQLKRSVRKEQWLNLKRWLEDSLTRPTSLTSLEQEIDRYIFARETDFFDMLDDIRVRRGYSPVSGLEMYSSAIQKEQLYLMKAWIHESRD
ncbi:hypothetical protein GF339_07550 [candidate division KSB3 bacterium]|uniref:Uncharacterized protein n=1 Tax=candidate division KSB3 bacterium TaxID=2044937 RepID=A0A9D5JUJ4_9BACT|nr:hypothetical protein [candidate division KSB3 bacterium]MBD3324425.1 hypothetical protein [candidate division KSB3 bacterium]